MNTMKKRGCQILVLFMTAGMLTGCGDGTPKLEDALKKTASYEMKTVEDPASDALGGEWTVMALARSGEEVDENYFEKYRANVEKRVKEQEGVLSENRYTEYSRAVLALKSIGKDPTDIGGYDIEKPLEDFDTVVSQGLNGAIYALSVYADLNGLAPAGLYEVTYDFGDITYNREEDRARWWQYVMQGKVPAWVYFQKFEGMSEEDAKAMVEEAQPKKPTLFGEE